MTRKSLTAPMVIALDAATAHGGKLVRHQGGYWSWLGCPRRQHDGLPKEWFATSTIHALVMRDRLRYSEWRDGRNGCFPIAAEVLPAEAL